MTHALQHFPQHPLQRSSQRGLQRRGWLLWAGASLAASPSVQAAHSPLGVVDPRRAPPDLLFTLHDGRQQSLARLLQGRISAVQLMFTGCSGVCPLQGALFAALQPLVLTGPRGAVAAGKRPAAQLLSLSIDPLGDDAKALATWRNKFGAASDWLAGVPPVQEGQTLLNFLNARSGKARDQHTAQTYLFDRQGRHAFTMAELAPAADVAAVMATLAQRG